MATSNWPKQIKDYFQNIKTLNTNKDVSRWEEEIRAVLGRPLVKGEISQAILWAGQRVVREEYLVPPGPQDVAAWIRHKKHEDAERGKGKEVIQKDDRPLTEEERKAILILLRSWIDDHEGRHHVELARAAGYRILTTNERMKPTDEYWDERKNDWLPLGETATQPDGLPHIIAGYKHATVRRRTPGPTDRE